jgi:hypothetical protein
LHFDLDPKTRRTCSREATFPLSPRKGKVTSRQQIRQVENRIEIINNTRGSIEGEIWERSNYNGGQIEIPDNRHTILGLHVLKPEKFKTRVTKLGVLYVLHYIPPEL